MAALKTPSRIILLSWLLVGTLDICAAFTDYYINKGSSPLIVLKYIASGVMGPSAYDGGTGTLLLGLFFHYFIAACFTILFFWLYENVAFISKNKIVSVILYGVFMWIVTVLIVLPLSKAAHTPIEKMQPLKVAKAILILIFMIGTPLMLIASKYSRRKI